MSKNSNSDLQKKTAAILIVGISFFLIGIISFIFRAEAFTGVDLFYCILSIGISFFLLPLLLFIIFGFVLISPGSGFIMAIIALIYLYNYPALAVGLGIMISLIGISMLNKQNNNHIS